MHAYIYNRSIAFIIIVYSGLEGVRYATMLLLGIYTIIGLTIAIYITRSCNVN
jgi:predicted exporter